MADNSHLNDYATRCVLPIYLLQDKRLDAIAFHIVAIARCLVPELEKSFIASDLFSSLAWLMET
jgi:hypothetical protein